MFIGIGNIIPIKGINGGGGFTPSTFNIVAESSITIELQTEDGAKLMVQEVAP
jgi:hypothetical protein|tara:strand:+ start:1790 stop:1948 length:159 start_codon:yes stop_codon:yes gene_type:complete